jgi:hypothetical protein
MYIDTGVGVGQILTLRNTTGQPEWHRLEKHLSLNIGRENSPGGAEASSKMSSEISWG